MRLLIDDYLESLDFVFIRNRDNDAVGMLDRACYAPLSLVNVNPQSLGPCGINAPLALLFFDLFSNQFPSQILPYCLFGQGQPVSGRRK